MDYPVTTLNVSERHHAYFSKPVERVPDAFWLAFSAFNSPDWIEFIVNRPTPVADGISVNHYSESVWVESCKNTLYAVE
jgi:hypothetical protein